ncbi:DHS-like NAD/FAD-binding domain-containing protein [Xylariales sp. AK1849]|nr:DHS-like NAD/FAD-binding domain-containing protein [Xylariales sp. AK1849]
MKPAKRRPGRPKGSGLKRGPKPKVQVKVHEVPVDDDQQVGHLTVKQAVENQHGHLTELEERVNDLGESWETESLFEDAIEDLAEDKSFDDVVDACKPEEAVKYRQLLRSVGPEEFCRRTVSAKTITAKKLLTAFGIRPPAFLEGAADEEYYSLLTLALSRELSKRAKLMDYNTVDDAVTLLQKSKNIVVLTGAGISTSLGIPDFRSKETGLYSQLANLGLAIEDPQEVFSIDLFREDPTIFYTVAKDILPNTKKFSPTHAFIAMLQAKGKLLTNYSQNIDNIEANAGISPEKLVQCHGSFATATCQKCGHNVIGETLFADIKAGKIPRCDKCIVTLRANGATKRKRSKRSSSGRRSRYNSDDTDDDDDFDIPQAGVMKPDITFFGEPLPSEFHDRLVKHDRDLADLVVVIGTSLKVAPVSEVVPFLPPHIPQIYISRTPVSHVNFDIDLLGDCDVVVAELCRRAGWDLHHEMIPRNQNVRSTPQEGYVHRHVLTAFKQDDKPGKRSGPFSFSFAENSLGIEDQQSGSLTRAE